jgi:hypothetical protein
MNLFFLFAVLLLVTQAPMPVPRQTPQTHAQEDRGVQPDTEHQQGDTHHTPASTKIEKPEDTQGHADGDKSDQYPRVISINKLPPIAMEDRPLSGSEWASLVFNGLLVLVGVGGIAVAIWTLCYLRKQVVEMARQRKVMNDTLTAIGRQAALMEAQNRITQDKERARITIVFPPPDPPLNSQFAVDFIDTEDKETPQVLVTQEFCVINDGPTWAFDVTAIGTLTIEKVSDPLTVPATGKRLEIARIIRNPTLKWPVESELFTFLCKSGLDEVATGKAFLFLVGSVSYKDVFGMEHETPFRYLWTVPTSNWDDDVAKWVDRSPTST